MFVLVQKFSYMFNKLTQAQLRIIFHQPTDRFSPQYETPETAQVWISGLNITVSVREVSVCVKVYPRPKTGLLYWLQPMSKKEVSQSILTMASWVLQGDDMQGQRSFWIGKT